MPLPQPDPFSYLDGLVVVHIAKLIYTYILGTSSTVTVSNVSGKNVAGTMFEKGILIVRCL